MYITSEQIKTTSAMAGVEFVIVKAITNKANVRVITNELNILKRVGLANWKCAHLRPLTQEVIKELYNGGI